MWCVAGHHAPIFSVNTANARSIGTLTFSVFRTTSALAATGSAMLCLLSFFGGHLERRQSLFPQFFEVLAQQRNPLGIHFVDAFRAGLAVAHQPRILKHSQMLRNGRPA